MNNRPLRTPAECLIYVDGAEIVNFYPRIQEVRVEMTRKAATAATIVLESVRTETGEWLVQDSGIFMPWKRLMITAKFGNCIEEVMRGFIKDVKVEYPESMNQAKVTVIGQDETLLLDRQHQRIVLSREDQPLTDGDIARRIAQDHGLDSDVEDGLTNATLQHTGTLIQLLQQRAEANGFELFVREGKLFFRTPQLNNAPFPTILVYAGYSSNCTRFSANFDGHMPDYITIMRAGGGTSIDQQTLASDLQLLGPIPVTSDNAGIGPFTWIMEQPNGSTTNEVMARGQAKANENAWKVKAEGELDGTLYGHVLLTYETVFVDGVGDTYSGLYYVDEVQHIFNQNVYQQQFKLLRNALGDNVPL